MKIYKRWFQLLMICVLALLLCIGCFNYLIDPYDVMKSPIYSGINDRKQQTNEYLWKTRALKHNSADALFIGSSRVRIGLDPEYYKQLTGETAYNLGLSSSTPYIQLKYLELVLKQNTRLNTVVLGLDFAAFREGGKLPSQYNEKRMNSLHWIFEDWTTNLLTMHTIKSSISVIRNSYMKQGEASSHQYLNNGNENASVLLKQREEMLKEGRDPYFLHLESFLGVNGNYRNYELSRDQFQYFKQIIALCEKHQIDLYVFINPAHAMQWEAIELAGLWDKFEQWKRELVSITPLWDFSGFHSVANTDPALLEDYTDTSHYQKHIGNYIFDKILDYNSSSVPADFGMWLTSEDIEGQLHAQSLNREAWEEDNKELIERLIQTFPPEEPSTHP